MAAPQTQPSPAAGAALTCAMCGQGFDPDASPACTACPLHAGCNLVCCPHCGYETIDTRRSRLAGWAAALYGATLSRAAHTRKLTSQENQR